MEQTHPPPFQKKKKNSKERPSKDQNAPFSVLDLGSGVVAPLIYFVHDCSFGSDKEFKFYIYIFITCNFFGLSLDKTDHMMKNQTIFSVGCDICRLILF